MMMRIHLFIFLTVIPRVWGKPVTDQPTDQTRAGPVSEQEEHQVRTVALTPALQEERQPLCFNVTDPDAMEIYQIYDRSKDKDNLFERKGLPLSDCSESGSVGLDTCRVCEGGGQVLALCHLSNPSAQLSFETNNRSTPLRTTPCDANTTRALMERFKAPPLQLTTPSTVPPSQPDALPLQSTTPSTAPPTQPDAPPPPVLSVGAIVGICVGVVVGVGVVAWFLREKIKSWWSRCYYGSVPSRDQENGTDVGNGAPAANGHALPCV